MSNLEFLNSAVPFIRCRWLIKRQTFGEDPQPWLKWFLIKLKRMIEEPSPAKQRALEALMIGRIRSTRFAASLYSMRGYFEMFKSIQSSRARKVVSELLLRARMLPSDFNFGVPSWISRVLSLNAQWFVNKASLQPGWLCNESYEQHYHDWLGKIRL